MCDLLNIFKITQFIRLVSSLLKTPRVGHRQPRFDVWDVNVQRPKKIPPTDRHMSTSADRPEQTAPSDRRRPPTSDRRPPTHLFFRASRLPGVSFQIGKFEKKKNVSWANALLINIFKDSLSSLLFNLKDIDSISSQMEEDDEHFDFILDQISTQMESKDEM